MPQLTVLLPAFNAAETIGAAIRSSLRALPRDAEIVVLDDGSTDETPQRVADISDARVRLHTRPNRGVAAALNELLASTDSAVVARMDADDVVLPGRFRRQLHAIHGGADAVFTTVIDWGRRGARLPRPSGIAPEEFALHLLLTNPVAHPTLMARRAALAAVGGYRELPTEDYDLWLRMALDGARMRRLAVPGLAYRVHPAQVTSSAQWRRRSWESEQLAASYTALAEQVLGTPETRLTALSIDDALSEADKRERLEAFTGRFEGAIRTQRPAARRALRRKLHARRSWFLAQLGPHRRVGA